MELRGFCYTLSAAEKERNALIEKPQKYQVWRVYQRALVLVINEGR
jgi:hypothetical protein